MCSLERLEASWNPSPAQGRRDRPQFAGGEPDRRGVFAGPAVPDHAGRPGPGAREGTGLGWQDSGDVVRRLRGGSRSYDDLRDHSPRPWRRPRSFRAQQYPRSRSRPHRRTARHTPARPSRPTSTRGGRIPPGWHAKHAPGPRNRDHGRRGPAAQGGLFRARRNGLARTGMRNGSFWPHPLSGKFHSPPRGEFHSPSQVRSLARPSHQIGDGPAVSRGFHPVGSTPARATMFRSTPGGPYRRPTP